MASEPINIFSRSVLPAEVLEAVRARYPAAEVAGDGPGWRQITVRFGRGKKARALTLRHDHDYYGGPDWGRQMNGMRGYFGRFPAAPGLTARVMGLIGTFRFALATRFDPDYSDPSADDRFAVLSGVTRLLDGVLFTPSGLRDPDGRYLLGPGGESDPDAEWPKVLAEAPAVPDGVLEAGEDGPDPPAPERVARRALALTGLTARAVLDREVRAGRVPVPEAEGKRRKVRAWLEGAGVLDEFEPAEREAFDAGPGALTARQAVDAMWRVEGLEVLGWALGRTELPRYDHLSTVDDVWAGLGFLDPSAARDLLANPTLRPADDLTRYRKQVLGFHWRLREQTVRPRAMDFRAFAADCWFGSFDVSEFDLADGDLAVRGHRVDTAPADVFGAAMSIARERHHAVNWLCYGPATYSDVDVGT